MAILWRDPAGVTHAVTVETETKKTATIQYLDNARRGDRYVAGRRYNHATRVRVVVYKTELTHTSEPGL